jgi:hypothetical protein
MHADGQTDTISKLCVHLRNVVHRTHNNKRLNEERSVSLRVHCDTETSLAFADCYKINNFQSLFGRASQEGYWHGHRHSGILTYHTVNYFCITANKHILQDVQRSEGNAYSKQIKSSWKNFPQISQFI